MGNSYKEIKVGSRIQVIKTDECFCDESLGKKGTVTFTEEDGIEVDFDDGSSDNGVISEVKLITTKKERMNFIVIWDEEEDPCQLFPTFKEAKAKVKELIKDEEDNKPHNIRIIEIKSLWTVEPEVKIIKQY
jgi:hypothetical protein